MFQNIHKGIYPILSDLEDKFYNLEDSKEIILAINKFSETFQVINILNYHLTKLNKVQYYLPFQSDFNKIPLLSNTKFEFSIIYGFPRDLNFKGKVLYSYPQDVYYCQFLDIKGNEYEIFEQKNQIKEDTLNENFNLLKSKTGFFQQNQTIHLRKHKDILKLTKSNPFFVYMLTFNEKKSDFSWEYDAVTLKPTRIALTNLNLGRISTSLKIIADLGNKDSIPILLKLSKHESHIIRWESVKAMINIDYDSGFELLKTFTNDKHEEVRDAALNSINLLENI